MPIKRTKKRNVIYNRSFECLKCGEHFFKEKTRKPSLKICRECRVYLRHCKRCNELFRTNIKTTRICTNCNRKV